MGRLLFKTGSLQSHSVAVSGGSNLARFALTVNYLKNNGLVENTNSDRLNIRANTSVNLLDNLSVNMDFQFLIGQIEKNHYLIMVGIFLPISIVHHLRQLSIIQ